MEFTYDNKSNIFVGLNGFLDFCTEISKIIAKSE